MTGGVAAFPLRSTRTDAAERQPAEEERLVRQTDQYYAVRVFLPASDQAPAALVDAARGGSGDRLPRSEAFHLPHAARTHRPARDRVGGTRSTPWRYRRRHGLGHPQVP